MRNSGFASRSRRLGHQSRFGADESPHRDKKETKKGARLFSLLFYNSRKELRPLFQLLALLKCSLQAGTYAAATYSTAGRFWRLWLTSWAPPSIDGRPCGR